jgi:RNA polymerase sigma-70 factor (ECF subfamily)
MAPSAPCLVYSARLGRRISATAISTKAKTILPERVPPLLRAYLDHRTSLKRLLTARCGSGDEAEDVLQELYVHLTRQEDAVRIDNPVAYLHRIAINLARDARRGRDRARRRDEQWADASQTVLGMDAIVEYPDAEAVYDGRERLARLASAIAGLPPQCRRVFTLHKLQGLTHAEVAASLGISRSAVEKHMHVALKHLALRDGRG